MAEIGLFGPNGFDDSLEIDGWEYLQGFYEGLSEGFTERISKVLGDKFLGLLVYGRPATPFQMRGKDIDVVIVSNNDAWNENNKNQLSEIREYLEKNNIHNIKIDAYFMPEKVFEHKIKRLAGASIEHSMEMKADNLGSWLTSNYRTRPTISLVPVYEKNGYLTKQIQKSLKNPVNEHPGSLNEFKI